MCNIVPSARDSAGRYGSGVYVYVNTCIPYGHVVVFKAHAIVQRVE